MFQLINAMYEYRSLIITTNKDFTKWGDFFFEDNVAVPVVDRIIHHSHIFMLGGESYRLKDKPSVVKAQSGPEQHNLRRPKMKIFYKNLNL